MCRAGGEDLAAWLVSQGRALAYRHYSTAYVDEEDTARAARFGIWRGAFTAPWDWRHGERVPSTSTSADTSEAAGTCCKVCTSGKACGNSCIGKTNICHKPAGCACDAQ